MAKENLDLVLKFLKDLEANNDREWFQDNKKRFEDAKKTFEAFVDGIIEDFSLVEDLGGIRAKNCLFRIYRDVRFSKNKSPYKTNMGASISREGRRSSLPPYYLHVQPNNESFIAGGLYMPEPKRLAGFREAIAEDSTDFKKILNNSKFKEYYGTPDGEKLKTAPRGFAKDHPEIELLRLKHVTVMHRVNDNDVTSDAFHKMVVKGFTIQQPFIQYLSQF